jgi:hypothetical protein
MPSWGKPDNAAPPAVKQLRGYKKRVEENRIKVLAERKEKRAKEARRAVAPPKRLVDLRWEPDLMASDTVDLRGRVLRKEEGGNSWTVGSELPNRGRYAFRLRIDHTHRNAGAIFVGVCDSGGTFARVFSPATGCLHCINLGQDPSSSGAQAPTQTLSDAQGRPCTLQGKADGSVIEVIVDVKLGTLAFRIDGGPVLPGYIGLPKKDALRPCVGMHHPMDQVTMLCKGLPKAQGAKLREQRRKQQQHIEQQVNMRLSARGSTSSVRV